MEKKKTPIKRSLEDFIIAWNVKFKYDRIWRKKYNIPFGSEQHLNISQIEIYLDYLEDKIIEKEQQKYLQRKRDLAEFEKDGKFLKETVLSQEEEDRLFKKIRLS